MTRRHGPAPRARPGDRPGDLLGCWLLGFRIIQWVKLGQRITRVFFGFRWTWRFWRLWNESWNSMMVNPKLRSCRSAWPTIYWNDIVGCFAFTIGGGSSTPTNHQSSVSLIHCHHLFEKNNASKFNLLDSKFTKTVVGCFVTVKSETCEKVVVESSHVSAPCSWSAKGGHFHNLMSKLSHLTTWWLDVLTNIQIYSDACCAELCCQTSSFFSSPVPFNG